ncbi:MAG: hypothetical protein ABJA67_09435 [Chthonomonadales bacterium]
MKTINSYAQSLVGHVAEGIEMQKLQTERALAAREESQATDKVISAMLEFDLKSRDYEKMDQIMNESLRQRREITSCKSDDRRTSPRKYTEAITNCHVDLLHLYEFEEARKTAELMTYLLGEVAIAQIPEEPPPWPEFRSGHQEKPGIGIGSAFDRQNHEYYDLITNQVDENNDRHLKLLLATQEVAQLFLDGLPT